MRRDQLIIEGPAIVGVCVAAIVTYIACLFLYRLNIAKHDEIPIAGPLIIRKRRVEGGFNARHMIATLFFPGLGHMLAGDSTRGAFFLCLTFIFVGLGLTVADPWGLVMIGLQWVNLFVAFVSALILRKASASGSFDIYALKYGSPQK